MPSVPGWDAGRRFGKRLHWRCWIVFAAFGLGSSATWQFREAIYQFLLVPAGGMLSPYEGLPIFIAPTEMFGATLYVSMRGGVIAALPVAAISLYTLVSQWIPSHVRRFIRIFIPVALACWIVGAAFAYYVMLPTGLRFLLSFGNGVAVPLIAITEYLRLLWALTFWMGVVFQIPLAMFLLAKMRLTSSRQLRGLRWYVFVAALILGAILTPTFDPVNQAMMAGPIFVLYEVGLIGAWLARPREAGHRTCAQKAKAVVAGVWRRRWLVLAVLLALALGGLAYVIVFVWDGRLPVEVQAWLDRAVRWAREVITRAADLARSTKP